MEWSSARVLKFLLCVVLMTSLLAVLVVDNLSSKHVAKPIYVTEVRHRPVFTNRSIQPVQRIHGADKRSRCADGSRKNLPDCLIAGFPKCGTYALLQMLHLHPGIAARTLYPPEVNFFNLNYDKGLDWYRKRMACSRPDQLTLEKSPGYVYNPHIPGRVRAMSDSVRLIFIVRNPVVRTLSAYLQDRSRGRLNDTPFEETVMSRDGNVINSNVTCVKKSFYYDYLAGWYDLFPAKNIHIVDGDRLITDPLAELRRIERFLDVGEKIPDDVLEFNEAKGFYCMKKRTAADVGRHVCMGAGKGRRHPAVSLRVQTALRQLFAPHNEKLFKLIGRQFSSWH